MTRTGQNVDRTTGDDRNITVSIYNAAGSLLDVSGASEATYSVRDGPGGVLLFAAKTKSGGGITIVTSTVTIIIVSADTLKARGDKDYYHELELILSGSKITAFTGRFRLRRSISGAGA